MTLSNIKTAVQTQSLRLPFKKALPLVAEMGARAVELDARHELRPGELSQSGLRQIRKWLDDYNLKVSAISFRTRRGYDVQEDLQRRVEATKDALRFAYQLGCPVVVNQVGTIDPSDTESEGWRSLCESLADLGRFSQRGGAWLAMDTGTESGEAMRQLIEVLPEGSVQVNFDPGNLIINGFSADEALRQLAPYVGHVHARDAVRDLARGRGLEVALGRGSVDFPTLLGTLEECGYRGYMTVAREGAENPIYEVSAAVEYLSNVG